MALHHPPIPRGCAHSQRSGALSDAGDVRPVAGRCRSRRGAWVSGVARRAIRFDRRRLHLPAVPAFGDTITPQFVGQFPVLSCFWTKAAIAPDQLRQRAMYSLSQLFVISMVDNNVMSYPQGIATYMDLLGRDAFGNFRQLLEDVTLSPMMGLYLSHLGNQKEDPATGPRARRKLRARSDAAADDRAGRAQRRRHGQARLAARADRNVFERRRDRTGARIHRLELVIADQGRSIVPGESRAAGHRRPRTEADGAVSAVSFDVGQDISRQNDSRRHECAGIAEAGARSSVQSPERRAVSSASS